MAENFVEEIKLNMNSNVVTNLTDQMDALAGELSGLVSNDVIQYIYTINLSIVCSAFCLCGIVTNVINIIVFSGMGFTETVNIALLGLSISDFCSVLSLFWLMLCFNPLFMYSGVPIISFEIGHKTGAWTHFVFTRVTAFITVYITLERCLCIAFPLKIKTLLTPKRVTGIIITIYVVIAGSLSVNYANFRYVWKFVPGENKTKLGMVFRDNRDIIQRYAYIFNVGYVIISFISVVICSAILVWKLNDRGRFLKSATTTNQDQTRKLRDRQVIKMVVSVAGIFIITFTPSVLTFSAMTIEPALNFGNRYENMFIVLISICYTFDAINSSVNIFIYYNMSSKYAKRLSSLFSMFAVRKKNEN